MVVALGAVVAVAAGVGWLVGDRGSEPLEVADPPAQIASWGSPHELVADDTAVWIAFSAPAVEGRPPQGPGGIVQLDVARGAFDVVAEIAELTGLAVAYHPDGASLWVVRWPGELVRLEAATGDVQARIDLPAAPGFADIDGAFLPNGVMATPQAVWVTTARGAVAVVDPARSAVADVVELALDQTGGGVARGPVAWIGQGIQGVARVDALATSPVQTLDPSVEGGHLTVGGLAMARDRLWVAGTVGAVEQRSGHDSGALVALDPDTGEVLAQADIPAPVGEVAVADDRVWARAASTAGLWRTAASLDGRRSAHQAGQLPSSAGGLQAAHDALWALDRDAPALLRLDADTGEVIDTIALPTGNETP